jgi:hypothetical protein
MSNSSTTKLPPFWIVILGVGVVWFLLAIFGAKSTLECNRSSPTPQCVVKDSILFAVDRSAIIPIQDIKKVDIIADSEEPDASAQLVLVTNTNTEIAIGTSGDYEEKDRIASQIAWFLENQTVKTFNLTDGNQTFAWVLFTIFSILLFTYLYQLTRSIRDRFKSG